MKFIQDQYERLMHEARMRVTIAFADLTLDNLRNLLKSGHNVHSGGNYYIVPPYQGDPFLIYTYAGPDSLLPNPVVYRTEDIEEAIQQYMRCIDPIETLWGVV